MQNDKRSALPSDRHRRTGGFIKPPQPFLHDEEIHAKRGAHTPYDITVQPTVRLQELPRLPNTPNALNYQTLEEQFEEDLDLSRMSTVHLMQLSGVMRAIRLPQEAVLDSPVTSQQAPYMQQSGVSPYFNTPYGYIDIRNSLPRIPVTEAPAKPQPAWKTFLNIPAVRVIGGLLIGVVMLLLLSRFVNIASTITILKKNLSTLQGILDACLAAFFFICAFSIRGTRWRLFLARIERVSVIKAIQIYWIGVFINFLLPVQGGELAKSLTLKRVTGIPVSRSLPTVAMDKALDLMPALIIMAIVPFIPAIHMSATLWIILSLVGGILIGLIIVVALTAWNRNLATELIHMVLKILPQGIGGKIESFGMGFVDSLLEGASRPKTFIPAILLTCLAVTCDGLFAFMAFLTVGLTQMSFGTALFGYTTYNMFSILPTAPGQVGSNEVAGELVFGGLLGFNKDQVLAMFVLSHPLAALIMTTLALISLSALGLTVSSAMRVHGDGEKKKPVGEAKVESAERHMAQV